MCLCVFPTKSVESGLRCNRIILLLLYHMEKNSFALSSEVLEPIKGCKLTLAVALGRDVKIGDACYSMHTDYNKHVISLT